MDRPAVSDADRKRKELLFMEKTLRSCADQIVEASIRAVLPDEAVRRALKDFHPEGRTVLVAAGKAAWQMAHAAVAVLGHVEQPGVSDRSGTPADAGRNDGIASRKEIPARLCGGCLGNGVSGQQDRTGKAAGRL